MREISVPTSITIAATENLTDAVYANAVSDPDLVVFSRKSLDAWLPVTAREFADDVKRIAAGLVASGVAPGDRVGLMSKTRYEWTVCDYGIWTAGGVTVPIYETSSAEQVAWILGDSGAVAVILESDAHVALFNSIRDQIPAVTCTVHIDQGGLADLRAKGADVPDADLEARRRTLTADSLATIIYTSGTTGRPKGCELTHRCVLFDSRSTTSMGLGELFKVDASTLLFLPLAHVFARLIQCGCVENKVRMGHTADIKNLLADFAVFQPTFFLSVPRVFEKVYNTAKQKAHADGKGKIFDAAEATAIAYSTASESGPPGLVLSAKHALFDKLVYVKLRAALGGKVRYAVSGGAPLGARLGHFFRGIGVTVLEGYGLTETSAGGTINLPDRMRIGTVGRPIPGATVRIADDGEILFKGANVFRGYWNNSDATKESIDADGWFHTGDIGELDADGFLKITGRKKELIVTAGGKNVAPAVLEDRLRAHPLVSQCVVVGDNQPFIGALVTIDQEAFPAWKKANGKPDGASVAELATDPDLRRTLQEAVDEANKAVSKAEAIKSFRVLGVDFTEEGGQLTPTLKLKRTVVLKEFAADVEAIYAGGAER